jgi:hypothetical protein
MAVAQPFITKVPPKGHSDANGDAPSPDCPKGYNYVCGDASCGGLKAEAKTKPRIKAKDKLNFHQALSAGNVRAVFSQDSFPVSQQDIVLTVWDGPWQFGLIKNETTGIYSACVRKLEAFEYVQRLYPVTNHVLRNINIGRARILENDHVSYWQPLDSTAPQDPLSSQSGRLTQSATSVFAPRQFTGSQPSQIQPGKTASFGGGNGSFAVGLRAPAQQSSALPQQPASSGAQGSSAAQQAVPLAAPAAPVAPSSEVGQPLGMSPFGG